MPGVTDANNGQICIISTSCADWPLLTIGICYKGRGGEIINQDLCHVLAKCSLSVHLIKVVCSNNSPCRETCTFTVHALLTLGIQHCKFISQPLSLHGAWSESKQKPCPWLQQLSSCAVSLLCLCSWIKLDHIAPFKPEWMFLLQYWRKYYLEEQVL